jgi:threonine dehydratase
MELVFKCENFQKVGAFKARGAFHAVERLKKEPGFDTAKGVVTHSSGNHAQALALAARENGIKAYIVMPEISATPKIAATKGYGAEVIFSGSTSVERERVTEEVVARTGARLVPPYDHPDIILGQGTLGLEMQGQAREVFGGEGLDGVLAPCGGGGMLSGVALSCEGTGIKVWGCEPEKDGADDAKRGYYAGKRVESVSTLTIADGLRTPVGVYPWGIIYERRLVSGMYSVSEEEIKMALRLVYERMKIVIEPSSAVSLATAVSISPG